MDLNSNKQQAKKKNLKEGPACEGTWERDTEVSEYPALVRSSETASRQEPQPPGTEAAQPFDVGGRRPMEEPCNSSDRLQKCFNGLQFP